MIPETIYKAIIQSMPILCVDIVLHAPTKGYLLVKRRNEPLKGEFWVVGGRVQKGETALEAAFRKVKEELGISLTKMRMLGVYEDFFDKNSMDLDTLYHTVSLVFHAEIGNFSEIKLDDQSSEWKFFEKLPPRLLIKNEKSI